MTTETQLAYNDTKDLARNSQKKLVIGGAIQKFSDNRARTLAAIEDARAGRTTPVTIEELRRRVETENA